MTGFDDREKAFENKYKLDQELKFKVNARRNKLLGEWAGRQFGLAGDELDAYAKSVVMADFDRPGDDDVLQKVAEDCKARGLAVPGLPRGAPGLEFSNPTCETACTMLDNDSGMREVRREMFETQLVLPDGSVKRWARH